MKKVNKKEKEIMTTIAIAIPKMSEFDKGYFLGFAESKAKQKRKKSSKRKKCRYRRRRKWLEKLKKF